jgi:CubicO group peptidase (beta-lactamase class C family)
MKHILLALLVIPCLAQAQTIAQKADQLLTAYADQRKFSGNVLIAKDGKVIFEKSYGYADVAGKRLNTPATEFRAGSLTKMITSAVILQLVADGKIALTDPVSKYVSNFPYGDSVRLVNLLSHTSGIDGQTSAPEPKDLKGSVSQFVYKPLSFVPGTQFQYNNFNYILLSHIAEKVTNVPYAQLVKQKVLDRAGMKHSGIDARQRKSENKAYGYVTNPATGEWITPNEGNVDVASGAGGLYVTAQDLYRWSVAMDKHAVLNDSLTTLALQPVQNNYGLGWMTTNTFGKKQLGHTGSIPGFIANFMKFPEENVTIVLLSNYQDVDARQLSQDLAAVTFGENYELPVVKKAVTLTGTELSKYVGEYKLGNGFTINVSTENNKLFALAQGDAEAIELTPEGNNKFFLKGPETDIEFLDENGEVKYMFVNIQGGQKLTKVK